MIVYVEVPRYYSTDLYNNRTLNRLYSHFEYAAKVSIEVFMRNMVLYHVSAAGSGWFNASHTKMF
jgi:hypothetical protein